MRNDELVTQVINSLTKTSSNERSQLEKWCSHACTQPLDTPPWQPLRYPNLDAKWVLTGPAGIHKLVACIFAST